MMQKKANFVHLGVARRRFMTRQFDFSFPFRLLASICTILSYSGKLFIYFYFARRDEIKNYYLNFYLNEIEPKPHPVPHALRDGPPRSRPLLLLPQTQHPHPGRNRRRLGCSSTAKASTSGKTSTETRSRCPGTWWTAASRPPATAATCRGYIVTKKQYENFILDWDWKLSYGGNSGMLYHVVENPYFKVPYVTGPEYQLIDNERLGGHERPTRLEEWQKLGVDYAMHLPNPDSLLVNPQGSGILVAHRVRQRPRGALAQRPQDPRIRSLHR